MAQSSTLREKGIGTKDRNAALAAEFWATLDATHGNSAQAKSLAAIVKRAEERHAAIVARKAAKAAARGEDAADESDENGGEDAATDTEAQDRAALKSKSGKGRSKRERKSFVKRMQALAAEAEAEGSRV